MRNLIIAGSLLGLLFGCSAKPRAATPVAAKADPANPVIVHVVSRDQTVTISSSPQGLLYSLKDADGRVMIADATSAEFAELQPELYRNIKHYIAVQNDATPLPADAGMDEVPIQAMDHARR